MKVRLRDSETGSQSAIFFEVTLCKSQFVIRGARLLHRGIYLPNYDGYCISLTKIDSVSTCYNLTSVQSFFMTLDAGLYFSKYFYGVIVVKFLRFLLLFAFITRNTAQSFSLSLYFFEETLSGMV